MHLFLPSFLVSLLVIWIASSSFSVSMNLCWCSSSPFQVFSLLSPSLWFLHLIPHCDASRLHLNSLSSLSSLSQLGCFPSPSLWYYFWRCFSFLQYLRYFILMFSILPSFFPYISCSDSVPQPTGYSIYTHLDLLSLNLQLLYIPSFHCLSVFFRCLFHCVIFSLSQFSFPGYLAGLFFLSPFFLHKIAS